MSSGSGDPNETWESRSYPIMEDMALQRVTWRVQRAGWAVLAMAALAALLGAFSEGPLSSTTATGADGRLDVHYDRFARHDAGMRMEVVLREDAARQAAIRLSPSLTRGFSIETIHPAPAEESGGPDGHTYVFKPGGDTLRIQIDMRPRQRWLLRGEIATAEGPPAAMTMFVYP